MPNQIVKNLLITLILIGTTIIANANNIDLLNAATHAPTRRADYVKRDIYRHPVETLQFMGIKPDMKVVEIWPGGGWYTEILAPYLKDHGLLYAAHFDPMMENNQLVSALQRFEEKMQSNDIYSKVIITVFNPPEETDIAPAGTADMVLTFRNLHNWLQKGQSSFDSAITAIHKALKPGGVLGVVEHRLNPSIKAPKGFKGGYVDQEFTIKKIEALGFKLVAQSEINANKEDTTDHPKGVWTLPPRLALGDKDKAKYVKIGESDRMTLKFIKIERKDSEHK